MPLPRIKTSLLLVSLLLGTLALAQTKAELVKNIGKEFRLINKDTTLKQVKLEGEAFLTHATDGGGELIGYYKKGQLKKIYQWIGLSNGNEIKEYYFKNGQLIFVYVQFNSFVYNEKKDLLDRTKTKTTFQGRYYFHNNRLIDHATTGHNRLEPDTISPEKTLLAEASDNQKLLNQKR
jgi:hypothetical protein